MIVRRFVASVMTCLVASLAMAGPQNYAQRSTQINAGILLIESQRTAPAAGLPNGTPLNGAPHVWGNLDRDNSIRPASWTFVNPRANTSLTQTLRDRWNALTAGGAPALNTRLSKRTGAYWEVSLANSSDDVLADFDVLLLPVTAGLQLNPLERERLRKFIDQGGILWVDIQTSANYIDVANPTPLPFALWQSNADLQANLSHPILSFPNSVTYEDLFWMQAGGSRLIRPVQLGNEGLMGMGRILGWIEGDSYRMQQIVGNGQGDYISVGQIGDGYLAVTTRGISQVLNRGYAGAAIVANLGFNSSGPVTDAGFIAAAKLAVNIVSLGAGFPGQNRGSRKMHSTATDLAAPLFKRWEGNTATNRQPVIFKGRAICMSNGRIIVLDANPSNDVDGDGNPDDGLPDAPGSSYDILWQSAPLATPTSAPTCAEVPNSILPTLRPGFNCVNQILVTDGNGRVLVFDLESPPGANVAPLRTIDPPDASILGTDGPYPPTIHEGLAFVADTRSSGNSGRVWIIDLAQSALLATPDDWSIQGTPRLPEPSGPPVVGYIPIADNSGGVDRVVYVPTAPSSGITPRPAGITSLWLGARGEKPLNWDTNTPGILRVTTRASLQGLPVYLPSGSSPYGVKISVIDVNGNPLSGAALSGIFNGGLTQTTNGELQFGLTGGLPQNASIRIDYTIDWGAVGPTVPSDIYVRGELGLPDDTGNSRRILGSPALSSYGTLLIVSGNGDDGGGLFCLREEGRGDFRLLYRWELYDALTFRYSGTPGQPENVNLRPAIIDEDYLVTNFLTFLNNDMTRLAFKGGPTVLGDTAYVLANARKSVFGFPSQTSILLAFKANPDPVEIDVENLQPGFTIVQPDVARSLTKNAPETFSQLQPAQYTFEPSIGGSNRSRIRFSNMMTANRGRIRDSLSTSLPIIIRRSGQGDLLVEPELSFEDGNYIPGFARGRWNPLKWYMVQNGYESRGQPMVAGETLYMAGSSVLPGLFAGQFPPITQYGMLIGMDSKIAGNDPYLKPISIRPWALQLNSVKPSSDPIGFSSNPDIRWPQVRGVQSFDDLRVRYLQAAIDVPGSRCEGVVGGEGVLLTWTASRVYAFARADFLIADEGRVSRFDSAGNPIWLTDSTIKSGESVPTGVVGDDVPLSRPTKVYSGNDNTYWIVDSGNDRIVRIDSAGRELRTVKGFKIDPKFRPGGLTDNETLQLRLPKDVLVYKTYRDAAQNPFTNPRPRELWVHYVIADGGNFRLLELVDRYEIDVNNGRLLGVVQYTDTQNVVQSAMGVILWHSPAELTGKQYGYNSISRTWADDGLGNLRPILAFGFGNVEPGKTSFGLDTGGPPQGDIQSGLGGIVLFDPARGASEVITSFNAPSIPANAFYVDSAGTFSSTARPGGTQKIGGLSSVTLRMIPNGAAGDLAIMFTDNTGVYELVKSGNTYNVRWMLPNEAFRVMRRFPNNQPVPDSNPLNFRAAYARRLDSDEVIVVSSYYGRKRNGEPYSGEVVLIDGSFGGGPNEPGYDLAKVNLGFNSLSVKFELPPLTATRSLVVPVFADRR
jgi:hypothetical protein